MRFYRKWVLPNLIEMSMRNKRLQPFRARVASAAEGRVLDVGVGSGLNLPFYAQGVQEIIGLEPLQQLLARAQSKARDSEIPISLLQASAERIPLEDRTIDTIVMTWDRLQHSENWHCSGGNAARAQKSWSPYFR
jgi:ubiquinone/menaquinone biosynthesis C-methylase UbiE